MSLDSKPLDGEVITRAHHLVELELGLGDGARGEERRVVHLGALGARVERRHLDELVLGLGVARAGGPADKLGQSAVERDLTTCGSEGGGWGWGWRWGWG